MTTFALQRALSRVEANVDNYIVQFVVMIAHGHNKTLPTLRVLVRRNNMTSPLLRRSKLNVTTVRHTEPRLRSDLIKPRNPASFLVCTVLCMMKVFHPETCISVTHGTSLDFLLL